MAAILKFKRPLKSRLLSRRFHTALVTTHTCDMEGCGTGVIELGEEYMREFWVKGGRHWVHKRHCWCPEDPDLARWERETEEIFRKEEERLQAEKARSKRDVA